MIRKYKSLYPLAVHIGMFSDWDIAKKKYYFYDKIDDTYDHNFIEPDRVASPEDSYGCVYIVEDKKSGDRAILALFNEDYIDENPAQLINTIAHESVHIADYTWLYIGGGAANEVNEPYAYLVGWIAGKISEYLIEYKANRKEDDSEEV